MCSGYGTFTIANRISRDNESAFTPHTRNPVKVCVRDAVLAEEEAQLGCMLLDVTHGIQHQFQITDGPPLPLFPREFIGIAHPFTGKSCNRAVALLPGVGEIHQQLIFRVYPFGWVIISVKCWCRKRRRRRVSRRRISDRREIQVEPVQRVIGDKPELAERWLGMFGWVAPQALLPQ
jgi:hypothetical protein